MKEAEDREKQSWEVPVVKNEIPKRRSFIHLKLDVEEDKI